MAHASANQTPHSCNGTGGRAGSATHGTRDFARDTRRITPAFSSHAYISVRACRREKIRVCRPHYRPAHRHDRMVHQTTRTAEVFSLYLAVAPRAETVVAEYAPVSFKRLIAPLPKLPEVAQHGTRGTLSRMYLATERSVKVGSGTRQREVKSLPFFLDLGILPRYLYPNIPQFWI